MRRWSLDRRAFGGVLAAGALAPPLLGVGGLGSALATLLLAALVACAFTPEQADTRDRLSFLQWLPASLLLAMVPPTAIGMLAAIMSTPVWNERALANLIWAAVVALPLAVCLRRSGRVRVAADRSTVVLTALPLAIVAAFVTVQPFAVWARIVTVGTDFERHVVMLEQVRQQGWLDYSANAYPRSAHATLALLQGASGDSSYSSGWQAAQGLLLIMFALMISTAGMLAARHAAAFGAPRRMSGALAPLIVCVLMFSGPWLTGNVAFGFLTTMQAGLLIVGAALLLWDEPTGPSWASAIGLVLLCAMMAHTYVLLAPIVALPTAWVALRTLRRGVRDAVFISAVSLAGLVFALPVLHASISTISGSHVASSGGHWLPMLGPLWGALVALAGIGAWQLSRARASRVVSAGYALMLAAIAALVVLLRSTSDGTLTGSYYWIKTGWTPIGLLLALAVPALLFVVLRARPMGSVAVAALLTAGVALTIPLGAMNLTVLSGDPERARPALSIPVFDQLEPKVEPLNERYIVWGLMPYAGPGGLSEAAEVDYAVQETLPMAGYPDAEGREQLLAVAKADASAVCGILQRHPDIIPITGPYPEGPLGWLASAGCPLDTVRPERWISIDVPPQFFQGTQWEGKRVGGSYPTWAQVQPARDRANP